MRLDRIIQALLPHDEKFFSFFDQSAASLIEGAEALQKLMAVPVAEREELVKHIKDLEHKTDEITHNIFSELNSTFVTPFDREDIHLLASALDEVQDCIDGTASRIFLYKVKSISPEMIELVDILRAATNEILRGVSLLSDMRRQDDLRACIRKINDYENKADEIFDRGIANLFDNEKNAVTILKNKEIFVMLETATDRCEDVGNVLESLQIKHA